MFNVDVVLGIRPDFIRTSKVLRLLSEHPEVDLRLVHTGQHYDRNLNDVFFEELDIPKVDVQLDTRGRDHNEQHAKLIQQYSLAIKESRPDVSVFLGDANAVIGCIAPLKFGVPIAHIEGGMRSYDWRMPEERNRVIIDRVSDVIYAYQQDYRVQLIQEGIPDHKIVVTGNVIVDVLDEHREQFDWGEECDIPDGFCSIHRLHNKQFALMTLHRNEHVENKDLAQQIVYAVGRAAEMYNYPVVLIEMPRLKALGLDYPSNFIPTEPLGFFDFVRLEKAAAIEFTDSGTNQEVASILGTPCVVTRRCTERPECELCGQTVLANSTEIVDAAAHVMSAKRHDNFSLGDGKASERIVCDLLNRLRADFYHPNPSLDVTKLRHFKRFGGKYV